MPCSGYILFTAEQRVGYQISWVDLQRAKIYDKRDDFDFEIVNFPFLDGDDPRSTSYGVYISQLIRFARASSYVADFNTRNKLLTQKLLKQGYRYHKLRKTFSKFYRRYRLILVDTDFLMSSLITALRMIKKISRVLANLNAI